MVAPGPFSKRLIQTPTCNFLFSLIKIRYASSLKIPNPYKFMKVECGGLNLILKTLTMPAATETIQFGGSLNGKFWSSIDEKTYIGDTVFPSINSEIEVFLSKKNMSVCVKISTKTPNVEF
jgi:hypothetical protein